MTHRITHIFAIFLLPLGAICWPGCAVVGSGAPPVQIRDLVAYTGAYGGRDTQIGIAFKVRNTSGNGLLTGKISFGLYQGGKPVPDQWSYRQSYDVDLSLAPNQEIEVVVALDNLFYYLPSGDLQIKDFYFSEITRADGGVWVDSYRIYKYPYENKTVTV